MNKNEIKKIIDSGEAVLGIELGSTRIKAVLIDNEYTPVAEGFFEWENRLENGYWTYHEDDISRGIAECYMDLKKNVQERYGTTIRTLRSIGISGMMHGYLAFDENGKLLVPFRTWRNTTTENAARELTDEFSFNIPQRWSIAHLYQAILDQEEHIGRINHITTLSGWVHWQITGEKVIGIGEASGMFPIDSEINDYDRKMILRFNEISKAKGWDKDIRDILPKVMTAGEIAGRLSEEGARFLDKSGDLQCGIPAAPPEGDAGTGMSATNSVAKRKGNVSAGTSIFSMVVLENQLSAVHKEIDIVTTPAGLPVAMVHCNNCTNEINAWERLFEEMLGSLGLTASRNELFAAIFRAADEGEKDCGGLAVVNYLSGEPVTGFDCGRPLLVRGENAGLSFSNLCRANLYAAVASLKIGMDILQKEGVRIDKLCCHGGFFKTEKTGAKIVAGALNTPVMLMETAGEGGAWGMALLAAYTAYKQEKVNSGLSLEQWLENKVFVRMKITEEEPEQKDVCGFECFMERYKAALRIERAAVEEKCFT